MESPVVLELLEQLRSTGVGASSEVNPFWKAQLRPLESVLGEPGLAAEAVRRAIGYNVARLPDGVNSNAELRHWPAVADGIRRRTAVDAGGAADTVAQLIFLHDQGVLAKFLKWADRRRLVVDLNLGRYWWYQRKLFKTLKLHGASLTGADYLEIGAGSGRMPLMFAEASIARHYIIVDLPEMLLNAALLIAEERPDLPLRLGEAPEPEAEPGFWLLQTSDIRKVREASVGLAVNINSLMEMDREVRDFYLEEVYRTLGPGGVFFNVNRRQARMTQRDGSVFDSNPLLYPYRPGDRILEWEVDACQMACKWSPFRSPASWAISRISIAG
jgi:SAM-dependent methyltransferase